MSLNNCIAFNSILLYSGLCGCLDAATAMSAVGIQIPYRTIICTTTNYCFDSGWGVFCIR